jgi:PadR family transcriptional regulator PadR
MKRITRKEELVMLSILNLRESAYLIAIKDYLTQITGRKMALTSAHLPLSRLEKKGYIESKFGEATAVRGGRRKKIYRLTKSGFDALYEYKRISDELWENYLKLVA